MYRNGDYNMNPSLYNPYRHTYANFQNPSYHSPNIDLDDLHENEIDNLLNEVNQVILDPTTLPILPILIKKTKLIFRVPRVIYQILMVSREGITEAFIPNVPNGHCRTAMNKVAREVLYPWIRLRSNLAWQNIQESLNSPSCRPIWPNSKISLDLQSQAISAIPTVIPLHVEGPENSNLVGLLMGQELGSAAEEKIPILARHDHPITNFAARVMFTRLVTSTRAHAHNIIDAKQEFFNRWLKEWPKRTQKDRWYIAMILHVVSLLPGVEMPTWIGGFLLQILDP